MPRTWRRANSIPGGCSRGGTLPGRAIEGWAPSPSRRYVSRKVAAFVSLLLEQFPDGVAPAGRTALR
jgi:hypothetical protein